MTNETINNLDMYELIKHMAENYGLSEVILECDGPMGSNRTIFKIPKEYQTKYLKIKRNCTL